MRRRRCRLLQLLLLQLLQLLLLLLQLQLMMLEGVQRSGRHRWMRGWKMEGGCRSGCCLLLLLHCCMLLQVVLLLRVWRVCSEAAAAPRQRHGGV